MPMTSLNISLPQALKEYVEVQVSTGDWGTPSEYIRELIRRDKDRRIETLERSLVAGSRGRAVDVSLADVRGKGLVATLRKRQKRR